MKLADEIYDAYLESSAKEPFTADLVNKIIAMRLHTLLCNADGVLSAIRHGRRIDDKELEDIYYPIRKICDEMREESIHT